MSLSQSGVFPIDLMFQSIPGAIAAYLIPHPHGAILIETGPTTTLPALLAGLKTHGYTPADITDVFLTHIHLDHAGAAGWLARQGARIHVHPVGAPHLQDPGKLLASATRIYGDKMETLWGEFLPVPTEKISTMEDGEVVEIEGIPIRALDTPGHANHHYAYMIGNTCFSGDIGGIRIGGLRYLRLPMPPPELDLPKWRQSLQRLHREQVDRICPTHFGIYTDPDWHLAAINEALDETEEWLEATMPRNLPLEQLRQEYTAWLNEPSHTEGIDPQAISAQETANPSFMSADGLLRYWKKQRAGKPNPKI